MALAFADPMWAIEQAAQELLQRRGIYDAQIIRTDPDSILYRAGDQPFTAWIAPDRHRIIRIDKGFIADYEPEP